MGIAGIVWLTIVCLSVSFIIAVSARLSLRRPLIALLITACLAGCATLYAYLSRVAPPPDMNVRITSPTVDQIVTGSVIWVSGTVDRSNVRVSVLVNPKNRTEWWVQSVVYPSQRQGADLRWSLPVTLGTAGQRDGTFTLVAVASSTAPWVDLLAGRALSSGEVLYSLPLWAHSEPITVRRAE